MPSMSDIFPGAESATIDYAFANNGPPRAQSPSKASQSIGLSTSACWKLARAFSGRLPFIAMVPARQCSTAVSGNEVAALDPIEAAYQRCRAR